MALSARLSKWWEGAARRFDLHVAAPAHVRLPAGETIAVDALLDDFGGANGMLLVADVDVIWPWRDVLVAAGYGFSVMDAPESERVSEEHLFQMLEIGVGRELQVKSLNGSRSG